MKVVGITGGIGVGKSIVCRVFSLLGVPIYDADSRARNLMHEPTLMREVKGLFGEESYIGGQYNRAYIAKIVFDDKEKLQQLNALVHPAVAKDFESWSLTHQSSSYVIKEAALGFETGSFDHLFRAIVVTAPTELRLERVLVRDPQRDEQQVRAIMSKQMPEEEKISKADHIIQNDGKKLVIPQVLRLHEAIKNS